MDLGPRKGLREAVIIRHVDREYGLRFMETYLNMLSSNPNIEASALNKALEEYKDMMMMGNKGEKETSKKVIEQDYKVFKKMFKPGKTVQAKVGDSITQEFKNVDIRNLSQITGK